MTTVTKKFLPQERSSAMPAGNTWSQIYALDVNASGIFANSDLATAIQIADVIRFGIIPAGITLTDAVVIISNAMKANTTYKLGFAYADGVDVTAVPQDDDYFIVAGTASSSAARTVANNTGVRPVTLPKDAYLIMTIAGAAQDEASVIDVVVRGLQAGV
jgi:hypothetical protein